jgi:hypothetical protein
VPRKLNSLPNVLHPIRRIGVSLKLKGKHQAAGFFNYRLFLRMLDEPLRPENFRLPVRIFYPFDKMRVGRKIPG